MTPALISYQVLGSDCSEISTLISKVNEPKEAVTISLVSIIPCILLVCEF